MFVGVTVACMPAASHTCRHLLPYYEILKSKFHMPGTLHLPHHSSRSRDSPKSGYDLRGDSARGRTLVDSPEKKKGSSGHRKYYENLSDMEIILPHNSLRTHIHRGDDNDILEDGHIHMTYEMQQSVS